MRAISTIAAGLLLREHLGDVMVITTPTEIRLEMKKGPWRAPFCVLLVDSK